MEAFLGRKYYTCLHMALQRTIWNERNRRCFGDGANSIHKIKSNCIFLFGFWCGLEYVDEAEKCCSF